MGLRRYFFFSLFKLIDVFFPKIAPGHAHLKGQSHKYHDETKAAYQGRQLQVRHCLHRMNRDLESRLEIYLQFLFELVAELEDVGHRKVCCGEISECQILLLELVEPQRHPDEPSCIQNVLLYQFINSDYVSWCVWR